MTEQNKDGAECGCAVLEGRSTWTGKWSFDFIAQCLQANGLVYILHLNFNDRCHFFSLPHFSYCVDSKRLNEFCILTRRTKIIYRLEILTYRPTFYLFSLSATLVPIFLTTKCKTNLILDKMDKINSLQ